MKLSHAGRANRYLQLFPSLLCLAADTPLCLLPSGPHSPAPSLELAFPNSSVQPQSYTLSPLGFCARFSPWNAIPSSVSQAVNCFQAKAQVALSSAEINQCFPSQTHIPTDAALLRLPAHSNTHGLGRGLHRSMGSAPWVH